MDRTQKETGKRSLFTALLWGATYIPVIYVLKHGLVDKTTSLLISVMPIITFIIYIYSYIKYVGALDEVKQRIQFEAVVIGFALSLLLILVLGLLEVGGVLGSVYFGFTFIEVYMMAFYFIGLFFAKRKYAS